MIAARAPNITADNRVQYLTAPTQTPAMAVGQLTSASASYNRQAKTVTIAWIPDATTGPQFSYWIEIFNNATFTGNPLITRTDIAPHLRSQVINVSSLPKNKTYSAYLSGSGLFLRLSPCHHKVQSKSPVPSFRKGGLEGISGLAGTCHGR